MKRVILNESNTCFETITRPTFLRLNSSSRISKNLLICVEIPHIAIERRGHPCVNSTSRDSPSAKVTTSRRIATPFVRCGLFRRGSKLLDPDQSLAAFVRGVCSKPIVKMGSNKRWMFTLTFRLFVFLSSAKLAY